MRRGVLFSGFINKMRNDTLRLIVTLVFFIPLIVLSYWCGIYYAFRELYGITAFCMILALVFCIMLFFALILPHAMGKLIDRSMEYRILQDNAGGDPIVVDTHSYSPSPMSSVPKMEFNLLECDPDNISLRLGVAFKHKKSDKKIMLNGIDIKSTKENIIDLNGMLVYNDNRKQYSCQIRYDMIGQMNAYLFQMCKNQQKTLAGYDSIFDGFVEGGKDQQIRYLSMYGETARMAAGIRADTNTPIHKGEDPELERLRILQSGSKKKSPKDMSEDELRDFISATFAHLKRNNGDDRI